jgi:HEAT repeat protein
MNEIDRLSKAVERGDDTHAIVLEAGKAGLEEKAVMALLQFKDHDRAGARRRAAAALGTLARTSTPARKALTEFLRDNETGVCIQAAACLSRWGAEADSVLPVLMANLSVSGKIHPGIARTLCGYGARSVAAVPSLISGLLDDDAYVRFCCAMALSSIGVGANAAVPALVTALRAECCRRQPECSRQEALDDPMFSVKKMMLWALWKIGCDSGRLLPIVTRALEDEDELLQISAVYLLQRMDESRAVVVDALSRAKGARSPRVRKAVLEAISEIQGDDIRGTKTCQE